MRLHIQFHLDREMLLPINHHHELSALVYKLLGESDSEYAGFLHDEGYALPEGGSLRYKLFVFSQLRVPASRRMVEGLFLRVQPGLVDWFLSSPREEFLTHSASALLTAGSHVRVGPLQLKVHQVTALPPFTFTSPMRFTSVTPIVCSVPLPDGRNYFLRPQDDAMFSESIRKNLARKYLMIYGAPPEDERLTLEFDRQYLQNSIYGGTKKITYKNTDIIGALAPFTLTGSSALMKVGYDCGFGQKNSAGFGMADIARPLPSRPRTGD